MADKKLLAKIKKLLALASKNNNANEAGLALERAKKLMEEHNINQQDVALMAISEETTENKLSKASKIPDYVVTLFGVVAQVFGVKGHYRTGDFATVTFYGPAERPQIASYVFEVLGRQLKRARREFLATQSKRLKSSTKTNRADAFCEAWVAGVYQVVTNFVVNEQEKELMAAYQTKLEQKHKFSAGKGRAAKSCNGHEEAREQGYRAGKKVKLHHGVDGSQSPALIGGDS